MVKRTLREFLADHPKLTSALFTLTLLLVQFGNALAKGSGGGGNAGP